MERLDEHLLLLEQSLANIENDYKPTCETVNYGNGCPGATDASREFWRRAVDALPAMLAEIRAHRAAALTDEDREALRFARWRLVEYAPESASYVVRTKAALAVLGRLIGQGERR